MHTFSLLFFNALQCKQQFLIDMIVIFALFFSHIYYPYSPHVTRYRNEQSVNLSICLCIQSKICVYLPLSIFVFVSIHSIHIFEYPAWLVLGGEHANGKRIRSPMDRVFLRAIRSETYLRSFRYSTICKMIMIKPHSNRSVSE